MRLCKFSLLTEPCLQAKHANGEHSWGINGETGKIVDMKEYGLYESASVKVCLTPHPLLSNG